MSHPQQEHSGGVGLPVGAASFAHLVLCHGGVPSGFVWIWGSVYAVLGGYLGGGGRQAENFSMLSTCG